MNSTNCKKEYDLIRKRFEGCECVLKEFFRLFTMNISWLIH